VRKLDWIISEGKEEEEENMESGGQEVRRSGGQEVRKSESQEVRKPGRKKGAIVEEVALEILPEPEPKVILPKPPKKEPLKKSGGKRSRKDKGKQMELPL
jgi:hypothetical protein